MKTLLYLAATLLTGACLGQPTPEGLPTPTSDSPGTTSPVPSPAGVAATSTPEGIVSPTPTLTPSATVGPTPMPTPMPITSPVPTATVPASAPSQVIVSVGGARFQAEVAATPQQRAQGLAERPSLAPGAGMLFVFEGAGTYQFWMGGMKFPLDFVWVGADCTVVDLTENAPPPQPGQSPGDLPRYSPDQPVQYVLEVNAGEVASTGIQTGDAVSFDEALGGNNSC